MNFDPMMLVLSVIPSGIGFVLLVYGKKEGRVPHIVAGLLLLVYPYFTETLTSMIAVGAAIGAGFYAALRLGW